MMRKISGMILSLIMLLSLMPAANIVSAKELSKDSKEIERTVIDKVDAISDIKTVAIIGEPVKSPTFMVTTGDPAYFCAGMGRWYKYSSASKKWENSDETTFSKGQWRFSIQIRIDNESALSYVLSKKLTATVNGQVWNISSTPEIHETYSYLFVTSPEFTVTSEVPKKYKVSYDANNGEKGYKWIDSESMYDGSLIFVSKPSVSVVGAPLNYAFEGVEINGTMYVPGDIYEVTSDTTVKFIWIKTPPSSVKVLKAEPAGKNKVKLSWYFVPGAEGYLIYAQKDKKYGYVGMTTDSTTFTDTKALDMDYNFYWVFAYVKNDDGRLLPGACEKYVYAKGVCTAVTNLKASAQKGSVKLSWDKVPDAEGYLVYGIRPGGSYGYIGMTTKGTTYTDTKASKTDWNFYWVYPYYKNGDTMVVGATAKYTYGKAR